jgi:hypothetical protein
MPAKISQDCFSCFFEKNSIRSGRSAPIAPSPIPLQHPPYKQGNWMISSCCHVVTNFATGFCFFFLGGTRTLFKLPTLQKPFLISFFFYYLFLLHTANVCSVANSPRQIKRKSKHFVTNNERFIAKLTNLRCVHWIIYLSTVLHQTICFRRKMRRRLIMSTSVILLKIIHFPAKCES